MQNVSFTGRKIFDGIMIMGDPIQQKTEMPEDINYLKEIGDKLEKSDIAEFTLEHDAKGSPSLKVKDLEVSFSHSSEYVDMHKIFIKDLTKKITHIFKKHEFEDSTYRKAFSGVVGTVEAILSKIVK